MISQLAVAVKALTEIARELLLLANYAENIQTTRAFCLLIIMYVNLRVCAASCSNKIFA